MTRNGQKVNFQVLLGYLRTLDLEGTREKFSSEKNCMCPYLRYGVKVFSANPSEKEYAKKLFP